MTHDELSKVVDNLLHLGPTAKALSAVVKMHAPMVLPGSPEIDGQKCYGCGYTYPCPTIWAIEKELE